MPRVNPSGLRRPVDRCEGLGFGVPAYAHPLVAPGEWAELARPEAPMHWVVLNVARGPGARIDPLYTEACARLRDAAVPVLGYLDTRHGARPSASWSPTRTASSTGTGSTVSTSTAPRPRVRSSRTAGG